MHPTLRLVGTHSGLLYDVKCTGAPMSAAATEMLLFKVQIMNPLGGAVLGKRCVCRVILVPGSPKSSEVRGACCVS